MCPKHGRPKLKILTFECGRIGGLDNVGDGSTTIIGESDIGHTTKVNRWTTGGKIER